MSCKYCVGDGRKCNEYLTIDQKVVGGNGGMQNVYEIYHCTRPKGHQGGHIACWDDDTENDPKKKHKSKSWVCSVQKKDIKK